MTIPFRPLTDLEVEKFVEERITEALNALEDISDAVIPSELLSTLESTIEDFDWESKVIEDHYDLYETYVDDHRIKEW